MIICLTLRGVPAAEEARMPVVAAVLIAVSFFFATS